MDGRRGTLWTTLQVKRKAGTTFVGLSAGMHSLIRPALYESYHEIVNLSRAGLWYVEWRRGRRR